MDDYSKTIQNLRETIDMLLRRIKEHEQLVELLQENRQFLKDNCNDLQKQLVTKDNYVKCANKWREEANEIFVETLMESYNELYVN